MPTTTPDTVPTSPRQIIEQTALASKNGSIHFADVVQALAAAGVEAYWADYRAEVTTYYLADDATHGVALPGPDTPIAPDFDAAALQQAIRGAQHGEVMYPEFLRLSRAAGCIGYVTWIGGRKVTYFGRLGQEHVERFPG